VVLSRGRIVHAVLLMILSMLLLSSAIRRSEYIYIERVSRRHAYAS
jgi:hypothetical protein